MINQFHTDRAEVRRCLVCHQAPCGLACASVRPDRLIQSVYFENESGAARNLADPDRCEGCAAPCERACVLKTPVRIREILSRLRADRDHMLEKPETDGIDLSCSLCGVRLQNPFLLSSSVVASGYNMCARAFESGWAGAAYKTVSLLKIHEASPRFSAIKAGDGTFAGFKNIEQLSDHALEENLTVFRRLKESFPEKVIIASVMARNEGEWERLAREVTEAGADAVELNFSCPNMENGGLGADTGQDASAVERFTKAARRGTGRPILAKMTPNLADMVPIAIAARKGGADGIAAINTIKSITNVDLNTFASAPSIRGHSASGGYSGMAVKPIALRFIADMAREKQLSDMHISGMGGVETWRDAVEYLLLGAGSIQVTTAVMQYGYRIIGDLLSGLRIFMAESGFSNIGQIIGAGTENVVAPDDLERDTVIYPKFIRSSCVGCGRCYLSCMDGGHQAIRFDAADRKPYLIPQKCVGCHLCILVCRRDAVAASRKRVAAAGQQ